MVLSLMSYNASRQKSYSIVDPMVAETNFDAMVDLFIIVCIRTRATRD